MLAIEPGDPRLPAATRGSVANPRRWIEVLRTAGTTAWTFAQFIDKICTDMEQNPAPGDTDTHRVFLWDNLSAHLTGVVAQTLHGRLEGGGTCFVSIPRPPYQPKYGPIEYKICDLIGAVSKMARPYWTTADMEQALRTEAYRTLGPFDSTFDHCGYTVDGVYQPRRYY